MLVSFFKCHFGLFGRNLLVKVQQICVSSVKWSYFFWGGEEGIIYNQNNYNNNNYIIINIINNIY